MKCIVLAGGKGDRLWPLSRKNYPKQFIQIQGDHSIFQETIARNMPYCDEFIIVTNREYQFIVENQLGAFQGLVHRFVFEEEGRKTTAAITLACMQLPLSETVLIVPADQLIAGSAYKNAVLRARELSDEDYLVTLGLPIVSPEERFGYIRYDGENIIEFAEKPNRETALEYLLSGEHLVNSGIFLFRVGNYLKELKSYSPEVYAACKQAYRMKQVSPGSYTYVTEVMRSIPALAVERTVFEKTKIAKVVHGSFDWQDVGSLEDLKATELNSVMSGAQVQYKCENTDIINQCPRRVVVANEVSDVIVVNTKDAVYVGKKGASDNLKLILEGNSQIGSYIEGGRILYRPWGSYELLVDTPTYRVKKVIIQPQKTILAHKHIYRSENWTVVSGEALIELADIKAVYSTNDVISVGKGTKHQVSNIGTTDLVIIEVSVGENVSEDDKVVEEYNVMTAEELGVEIDDFIKLKPIYRDYLWGGTRLKDCYSKECDYDTIAESWELAAHDNGQSIVTSGKHRGLSFGEYLSLIGKNNWGWKCGPLDAFPILIKFIDAKEALSVQVHPDDEYALCMENQYGKNEMWYIVDCDEDAFLYCGFNRDVSREEVAERIRQNTILEVLNKVPVKRGDAIFVPAGTVHAIGAGILICEIQQSSDCTYRLYDYERKDKFGNLRELHIDKALDVINYNQYVPQLLEHTMEQTENYVKKVISSCKYFECVMYSLKGRVELSAVEESFTSMVCLSGKGSLRTECNCTEEMHFVAGESIFIPKSTKTYIIDGECELIITRI